MEIRQIFQDLGFSENAFRVYNRLLEHGTTSVRRLSEDLSLPRPTIYDALQTLNKNGLVLVHEEGARKTYTIDDPRQLQQLLQEKITVFQHEERQVRQLLPALLKKEFREEPRIRFYRGKQGIRQVLNNLLWYKDIETLTMWPIGDMVPLLGEEYLANLNRRRIRQNISIRGIWPQDKKVNVRQYPFLDVGKRHLRQLRLAPGVMTWDMSYWQYEDKVALIASGRELFGFVVQSADFVSLLRAQFELIWKLSKPLQGQPEYSEAFLKTV